MKVIALQTFNDHIHFKDVRELREEKLNQLGIK